MTIHALTRTPRRTSNPVPARRATRLASALGSVLVLTAGVLGAGALTAAVPAGAAIPAGAAVPARAGAAPAGAPAADRAAAGLPGPATAAGMRFACAPVPLGDARCFALFRPQTSVNRALAAGLSGPVSKPSGLTPRQIESAYRLPIGRNPHQTVAVVEAYHTPHLVSWLYTYRKTFGLPACTVRSGCLRVVNQQGKSSPVPSSGVPLGWDVEASLDVSMVSVACPHCHILVVEATTQRFGDLAKAEDTAARLGATEISNSYGGRENGFRTPTGSPTTIPTTPSWSPRATRASRPPPSPPTSPP